MSEKYPTIYKISISGPGMCLNNILAIIQDALANSGMKLEITNEYLYDISQKDFLEKKNF